MSTVKTASTATGTKPANETPANALSTPVAPKSALEQYQEALKAAEGLKALVEKEAKDKEEAEVNKWKAIDEKMASLPGMFSTVEGFPANAAEQFAFFSSLVTRMNSRKTTRPALATGTHVRTGAARVSDAEVAARNERIIELRKQGQMTIQQIASEVGVSTGTVNIEIGKAKQAGKL